jgi:protoporphyrinogen oxidase
MQRRRFIELSSTLAGLSLLPPGCTRPKKIPGEIVGASAKVGHLLRDGFKFPEPTSTSTCQVAIVGAGISGLSAARWLHRNGVTDLRILDLEAHAGGNAASGSNRISEYPWGAHYVPIINNDLPELLDFFREAGIITGYDDKGLPIYNEYDLCFDPQERLFLNGKWQPELMPRAGLSPAEAAENTRFLQLMDQFRVSTGADGLQAFTIPIDRSSKDPVFTRLDTITMTQWLSEKGFRSPYLRWYVNYCMRDDFGTTSDQISAWTGIHYYAARKGLGANAKHYDVLTWAEGNGRLVRELTKDTSHLVRPNALVISIDPNPEHPELRYYDTQTQHVYAIKANHILLAVPQFVANRLLPVSETRARIVHDQMSYTPWMVANLTVNNLEERTGAPLSWDNVIYGIESLGYVEATHQQVDQIKEKKVLTFYWPITDREPVAARLWAVRNSHEDWTRLILADLRKVHPDIEAQTDRIDIMVWGHAMAQPRPGWIHGGARQELQKPYNDRIHFAHTDLAGISIFEEGFYQGIRAASKILTI